VAKINGRLRALIRSATGEIVKNGEVEIGRLGEPDGLLDLPGLSRDAVAELFEHVGHHHPDHDLVLDEEDRTARRPRLSHGDILAPTRYLTFANKANRHLTFANKANRRNVNVIEDSGHGVAGFGTGLIAPSLNAICPDGFPVPELRLWGILPRGSG
jgi:hypothetical protein